MHISFSTFTQWAPRLVLVSVGLIAVNLIWFYPAIRGARTSASILALEINDRFRKGVESYLATALNEVVRRADEIVLEPDRQERAFNRILKNNSGFRDIALVDLDGKETARIDRFQLVRKEDFKEHSRASYFRQALAGRENFGDVFITPEGEPHIVLAVPMRGLEKIEGVIVATLNLRSLIPIIKEARVPEGIAYVVDQQGFLIITRDITELLRHPNMLERSIVKKVIVDGKIADGLAAGDGYSNEKGQKVFAVGLPIALNSWGIFFEQPRRQALATERTFIVFAVVVFLLGIVIVLAIMRGTVHLGRMNSRLNNLLAENYDVGKILVRRDIELTEANSRLESLDISKSEFVSVAAHQLRTPITGIRWTFNALMDQELGPLTAEQQKVMNEGLRSSLRMIALINDLLNVARIEEGRFGFRFKHQPLTILFERLTQNFARHAEEKGISLVMDIAHDLPPLDYDEEKMQIAMDNLVDNAIKYTPPGGSVTIRAVANPHAISITVQDTGIGIPEKQMNRLFSKFFRADNAMKFQTSGNGLGLYVAKNIIESHGGAIEVESVKPNGTLFAVTLPVRTQ